MRQRDATNLDQRLILQQELVHAGGTASFVGADGGVDGRSYAATETVVSVIRELDR